MKMLKPVLKTPPTGEIVTTAEMKAQLRVENADEDAVIASHVQAATEHFDGYKSILRVCLLDQVWEEYSEEFSDVMALHFENVKSIESLKYFDKDDAEQTIDPSNYALLQTKTGSVVCFDPNYSFPQLRDRRDAVTVEYTAGFGEAADVPKAIKQAVVLTAASYYSNREELSEKTMTRIPTGAEMLVRPYVRITGR